MKILLFAAVAMTALSAGTAVAGEGGGNPMNRRLSGADHSPNTPMPITRASCILEVRS